jgi:hypothetical protein
VKLSESVRHTLADANNPRSVSSRARAKRWQMFVDAFPEITSMRVLDLGGTAGYWRRASPPKPMALTVVNLQVETADEPWIESVVADACDLDASFTSGFDLVYSNSLIEHVGGWARRQQFADVVHRASEAHWVQTPYRYFPVEPHWLFPGFQFLPAAARARISSSWRVGHIHSTRESALQDVLDVELLGRKEFAHLFPTSTLVSEKFAGLPKSLIAIRK